MRVSAIVSVAALLFSGASKAADNAACWGDAARVQISCTPLTEKLLLSLEFAPRRDVVKAMKAEGRSIPDEPDLLVFISNAKRGAAATGVLNIRFRTDQAVVIYALIDRPGRGPLKYIWNAELGGCSDFPDSNEKCNK
jgi:hypothetical protein